MAPSSPGLPFIPIYLLATDAIFIPFLSNVLRNTFSYTFTFLSIVLAVNNFSLIIFDSAFIIDTIVFNAIAILITLFCFAILAYFIVKKKLNIKETVLTCLKLFLFVLFVGLIHLGFLAITWLEF
jgi:hypothetical protein